MEKRKHSAHASVLGRSAIPVRDDTRIFASMLDLTHNRLRVVWLHLELTWQSAPQAHQRLLQGEQERLHPASLPVQHVEVLPAPRWL